MAPLIRTPIAMTASKGRLGIGTELAGAGVPALAGGVEVPKLSPPKRS